MGIVGRQNSSVEILNVKILIDEGYFKCLIYYYLYNFS